MFATRRDAANHSGRSLDTQPATGKVVQKVQGLCPLNENVVDAHRHQIDPNGVMPIKGKREFELGPDAVSPRNQDGLPISLGKLVQGAKPPNTRQHAGIQGATGERLDSLHQRIAGLHVNPCIAIRNRLIHPCHPAKTSCPNPLDQLVSRIVILGPLQ